LAQTETVTVPDIGDFDKVDVMEVLVEVGQRVEPEQSLITLESDKATLEVPSPAAGTVEAIEVSVGDRVAEGSPILTLRRDEEASAPQQAATGEEDQAAASATAAPATDTTKSGDAATSAKQPDRSGPADQAAASTPAEPPGKRRPPTADYENLDAASQKRAHASPAVRRFARELGVDLGQVQGSGPKGRILKEDVQAHVKTALSRGPSAAEGAGIPPVPQVDFSKFGETETVPLSRIKRKAAPNLHRSWLNLPHVTQFDEADVTELEAFRKSEKASAEAQGVKLTLLPFLLKACANALAEMPQVNSSLDPDGEHLIVKRYIHIGIAVDTEGGLLVPVIRDVDRKSLLELAGETADLAARAREGKLGMSEMQGASFTISSLGGIGGTAFTPIINAPEVAILGVSKMTTRPVYIDGDFQPRLMLPLSLSYDHRVIDGADAARFTTHLGRVLGDLRRLLL